MQRVSGLTWSIFVVVYCSNRIYIRGWNYIKGCVISDIQKNSISEKNIANGDLMHESQLLHFFSTIIYMSRTIGSADRATWASNSASALSPWSAGQGSKSISFAVG